MANVLYNSTKKDLISGGIDLDTDSIYIMLVTSTYTPDQDAHTKRSDVTNEVTGTGYTAGGVALASKTCTQDNTNNRGVFDAADASWTTSTITARGAVLYKNRGGASSADELVGYLDFGSNISSTSGTFTVQFHTDGILYIS